jgi:serine/threonine protein phosphatase PrpC
MAEPLGDAQSALAHAALSDVGLRRANNQDSFAVALAGDAGEWYRRGHLFMVADGMGAHAAGELASKMACESVPHTYRKLPESSPAEALKMAITAANTAIHDRGEAHAEFQGMGTTSSMLVLLPREAIVAHVGDSRVYRLRDGTIEQLTFDHSLVWEMMAAGQMPRGEVASFIPKNIITRSLGPRRDVQIDLEGPFPLAVGDTFLLCSDGLSGQATDEELGCVMSALSPEESARAMVDLANLRGGPDNVTALVIRVENVPPENAQASNTSSSIDPPSTPLAQALWVLMALGMLIALLLIASGNLPGALASGLLAAAAAVVALLANLFKSPDAAPSNHAGPLGSGPHAAHACAPNAERVAELCKMAQQLREAAKDEHWTLDWAKFNQFGENAQAALVKADFVEAVRQYALAISFMMSEIRHQPSRKDHRDRSVLDL